MRFQRVPARPYPTLDTRLPIGVPPTAAVFRDGGPTEVVPATAQTDGMVTARPPNARMSAENRGERCPPYSRIWRIGRSLFSSMPTLQGKPDTEAAGMKAAAGASGCHDKPGEPMRTLLAALVAVMVPTTLSAETIIGGIGTMTCGAVSESAAVDSAAYHTALTWVQGYMSAVNDILASTGRYPVVDLNPEAFTIAAQLRFLRCYCESHPTAFLYDAGISIFNTLRGERGSAVP